MPKLTTKQKAQIYDAQQLVRRFNELYPIGSTVEWRSIGRAGIPYTKCIVAKSAFEMHGQAVVFFENMRGCVSIEPIFVNYPN